MRTDKDFCELENVLFILQVGLFVPCVYSRTLNRNKEEKTHRTCVQTIMTYVTYTVSAANVLLVNILIIIRWRLSHRPMKTTLQAATGLQKVNCRNLTLLFTRRSTVQEFPWRFNLNPNTRNRDTEQYLLIKSQHHGIKLAPLLEKVTSFCKWRRTPSFCPVVYHCFCPNTSQTACCTSCWPRRSACHTVNGTVAPHRNET